jgi:hypothetical protein
VLNSVGVFEGGTASFIPGSGICTTQLRTETGLDTGGETSIITYQLIYHSSFLIQSSQ